MSGDGSRPTADLKKNRKPIQEILAGVRKADLPGSDVLIRSIEETLTPEPAEDQTPTPAAPASTGTTGSTDAQTPTPSSSSEPASGEVPSSAND